MPRIVMKFGGTSMAGIERIRSVAARVQREAEARQRGAGRRLGHGRRDRPAGPALPRSRRRSTIRREYDVVVASGRAGDRRPARDDPPEHGPERAQLHGLAAGPRLGRPRQRAGRGDRSRDARRGACAAATVAVIPGFQGVTDRRAPGDARPRRVGHFGGRDRGRRSRPTAATSTPTSTASTPPTRASCPRARKLDQVTFEEMLELAGVGAKVLQIRSVGLAMRENLPLRVLSAFEDKPGTRHRRRAFRRRTWNATSSRASPPTGTRRGSR